ncbi:MAG: transcription termination/antitermination protein NusG [Candidatus Pacebacteria bacterium]|nr:transcription termination/antitermination protein NusG [Candidatus Paceibacterota bacterium]
MADTENSNKGRWYVVHTLSGQEFRVQETIMKRRALENLDDEIFEIIVPTENVSEVRRGRKSTTQRKCFPGYILVRMNLYDQAGKINNRVWYFIKETQGVIGLIGGDKPMPLSDNEVEGIMAQARGAEEASKPKVDFEVGETVTIREGAFENFEGVIEDVDPDRGKLRLSVSIFGRSTPVEVEYWQVERG